MNSFSWMYTDCHLCYKILWLGTEESYLRQLEIEEMYGVKKDDDKKSKEK